MKELGQFQQSLIRTGQALPSGVVPPISSTLKYDQASDPVYQAMSARVNAPQTPLTPPVSEPNAYTKYFADPVRSAATTGANAMGAVGNAFTSSEQKLGGIIGDAAASAGSVRVGGTGNFNVGIPGTGGQSISDQAAQNDANTQQMISRVQHQITLDKSQGKDTSHLEQVLTMALGNKKSAEQQIAEQAPGSLATNEEATGALGGVALDLATAGTAGPVGKPIEGAVKTFDVGAKGFGQIVKKGAKEGLKVAPVTAAYGATQAMQDNGSVGDIAGSAAISGAGGFLVPAVGSIVPAVKQIRVPTTKKALADLPAQYDNMLGRTQTSRKAQTKSAKFDNDPTDLLVLKARHGAMVDIGTREVSGVDVWDTSRAVEQLNSDVNDIRTKLYRPMLEANPARVSLDEVRDRTASKLKATLGSSEDYPAAIKELNNIVDGLKAAPNHQKGALNLVQLDDIKMERWAKSRAELAKEKPKFSQDIDYQLGQTLKSIIEERMPDDALTQALNHFVGQHMATIEQLQKINDTGVGSMRIGKHALKTLGAITGGASGGTAGAIGGAMMGDKLSQMVGEFSARNPFSAKVLEGIKQTDPKLIQQMNEFLPKFIEESKGKVALPLKKAAVDVSGKQLITDLSGGKPTDLTRTPTKVKVNEGVAKPNLGMETDKIK